MEKEVKLRSKENLIQVERIIPFWKKELSEKFLKDASKEKVLDTSQEEIEKGDHIVYPLKLMSDEVVNNKKEFLFSEYWEKVKFLYLRFLDGEFKQKRGKNKMKCQMCGEMYAHEEIQLHHLTYKNFGNENPNELIRICFVCHSKIHKREEVTKTVYKSSKKFNKKSLFNLNDLITFGKYKEEKLKLKDLIDKDKKYVLWLVENNVIRINEKVQECLRS